MDVLEDGWVNFAKMTDVARTLQAIKLHTSHAYKLLTVEVVRNYLLNPPLVLEDKELSLGSRNCEPSQESPSTSARTTKKISVSSLTGLRRLNKPATLNPATLASAGISTLPLKSWSKSTKKRQEMNQEIFKAQEHSEPIQEHMDEEREKDKEKETEAERENEPQGEEMEKERKEEKESRERSKRKDKDRDKEKGKGRDRDKDKKKNLQSWTANPLLGWEKERDV